MALLKYMLFYHAQIIKAKAKIFILKLYEHKVSNITLQEMVINVQIIRPGSLCQKIQELCGAYF